MNFAISDVGGARKRKAAILEFGADVFEPWARVCDGLSGEVERGAMVFGIVGVGQGGETECDDP